MRVFLKNSIIKRVQKKRKISKTLIRYIVSYILMMMIPLTAFYLSYQTVFYNAYKNKLLVQYQNRFERIADDLENLVAQMLQICSNFALQESMSDASMQSNNVYYGAITKVLNNTIASGTTFSGIGFYTSAKPDLIFTDLGTYNVFYYKRYQNAEGKWIDFQTLVASIPQTWLFTPSQVIWPYKTGETTIDYIIPLHSQNAYVIFSIKVDNFLRLIGAAGEPSIIILNGDRQVYPYVAVNEADKALISEYGVDGKFVPITHSRYLLYRSSKIVLLSSIRYVQFISNEDITAEMSWFQQIFFLIFAIVLILGGLALSFLTNINYNPIRKLNMMVLRKPLNIPKNLGDVETIAYALNIVEQRNELLRKNNLQEKLLVKLIHGKGYDSIFFESECKAAGLSLTQPYMRVLLLYLSEDCILNQEIDIKQKVLEILSAEFKACGVEYVCGKSYLFVIGAETLTSDVMRMTLSKLDTQLTELIEGSFKLCVSTAFDHLSKMQLAHKQCVSLKDISLFGHKHVLFYEDIPVVHEKLVFPKEELDTLYYSIIHAKADKLQIVTDILVEAVKANDTDDFFTMSLCCEIIKTFLKAMDELENSSEMNSVAERFYPMLSQITNTQDLINVIYDMRNKAIELITCEYYMDENSELIQDICCFISNNSHNDALCVNYVAEQFKMSLSSISHKFKAQTGINISDYISQVQMDYAKKLLHDPSLTIADVASKMGFSQASSFIRKFKRLEGITPSAYRDVIQIPEKDKVMTINPPTT